MCHLQDFFLSFWWRPHRWLQSRVHGMGYKWFSRKMIKKNTCAGRQSWAVGNSEFVMCNWQYELWLLTIYSVILHVLLSVNSGHAKYTSMAFFSKKNWWSWALGLRSLYIYIPSPYQRNAYISRIVWWNHGSDFFLSEVRMYFVYIFRFDCHFMLSVSDYIICFSHCFCFLFHLLLSLY